MDELSQTIQKRIQIVLDSIDLTAKSAGRLDPKVKVVVVTKLFPVQMIRAAVQAGASIFGENYPEEGVEKIKVLQNEYSGLQWHMIGHCQSRKVKIVAEYFQYFHSCDSLSVAKKLNRALSEAGRILPVLLEFNVSGEQSKYGWNASDPNTWEDLLSDIYEIRSLPNLDVQGLMTMPPYCENPELSRPYFVTLVKLRDFLLKEIPGSNFTELSMGTSVDYKVAVQEGATFVRIGEAILGPRVYKSSFEL